MKAVDSLHELFWVLDQLERHIGPDTKDYEMIGMSAFAFKIAVSPHLAIVREHMNTIKHMPRQLR